MSGIIKKADPNQLPTSFMVIVWHRIWG